MFPSRIGQHTQLFQDKSKLLSAQHFKKYLEFFTQNHQEPLSLADIFKEKKPSSEIYLSKIINTDDLCKTEVGCRL